MPDNGHEVVCPFHGRQSATFVCQHIVQSLQTGKPVGFNPSDNSDKPRPDAWCDECEKVRIAEGGDWNDRSESFAGVTLICAGCYDRARRINEGGFVCDICGKFHAELPLDLAYQRPADYFKVPEGERATRIKINDDVCIVDGKEFYIRGVLALPIREQEEEFRWGVWVQIDEQSFRRYLELWDTESVVDEPQLAGRLSGGIKYYSDSDMLEVTVQLQPKNQRPRFWVVSDQHSLGIAQRMGITMNDVHSFIASYL